MDILDFLHENVYQEKVKSESIFVGWVCPGMRATPKTALICQRSLCVVLELLPD